MKKYILQNLLNSALIVFGVITVTYILTFQIPGDPVKLILGQRADEETVLSVKQELGLNDPVIIQYTSYLTKTISLDLGKSYVTNRDVFDTIIEKFPATAVLGVCAMLIASVFGILFGIVSAIKPYSFYDYASISTALIGISIPQFVLALFMIFIFGSTLDLFPVAGYINNGIIFLFLPALSLSLRPMAITARITRTSMTEILSKDYIRTARAKGVGEFKIIFKHALRNALNPIVTSISASLASTLGGVFFIEYIFNWPGIGSLALDSIMKLDFPMIQGTILFSAVLFVIINLAVDIIYAVIDPKVKLG
ncbi:MAG: ABC transporter permease [Ignavibacteria bacterium]|jgi:peptide/nickel transport system permease protein|nr:ABC transporter permease [Ignavibacteria bacterium]